MAESAERPSLDLFERHVEEDRLPDAFAAAWAILSAIDRRVGRIDQVDFLTGAPPDSPGHLTEFATRFAAAFGTMVVSPRFQPDAAQYEQLQVHGRWVDLLFRQSGFGTADHFIRLLAPPGASMDIPAENILKLQLLHLPGSSLPITPDMLAHGNLAGSVIRGLSLCGSRYHFGRTTFDRREEMLRWLPDRMDQVKLGEITLSVLTEPYFHCSYAIGADKHRIKAGLISQVRRLLLEGGATEWTAPERPATRNGKPVFVVTSDYINRGHSIWRTHSRALRSLRQYFHVIGMGQASHIHEARGDLFDETIALPEGMTYVRLVTHLADQIREARPAGILHVSIGMLGPVIGLASLRLAPVQFTSYGHTATTMSPAIDYYVLPEDFVGDASTFSEQVMALPKAAFPYEQRTDVDFAALRRARRPDPKVVNIAVPGTVMKLNPVFFETLAEIARTARRPLRFHFFPGFSVGLAHRALERDVHRLLPDAVVNAELPYAEYCAALSRCAFTLSPFPYGNMNTVIESVALGLPGVCLDGPEAHTHADGALYRRLGLPDELVAPDIPAFVKAAVRLVDDDAFRERAQRLAARAPIDAEIYTGDERIFADAIMEKVRPFL